MSDLDKILLTALTTVIVGVIVFTVGQVLVKFLIEPIYEQRRLVGTVGWLAQNITSGSAPPAGLL